MGVQQDGEVPCSTSTGQGAHEPAEEPDNFTPPFTISGPESLRIIKAEGLETCKRIESWPTRHAKEGAGPKVFAKTPSPAVRDLAPEGVDGEAIYKTL
jgi:hypothetical protein